MKIHITPYLENVLSERFVAELVTLGVELREALPEVDDKVPEVFGNAFHWLLPESFADVEEARGVNHMAKEEAIGAAKKTFDVMDSVLRDRLLENRELRATEIEELKQGGSSDQFIEMVQTARSGHLANYGKAIEAFKGVSETALLMLGLAYDESAVCKYLVERTPEDFEDFSIEAQETLHSYVENLHLFARRHLNMEFSSLFLMMALHAGRAGLDGEEEKTNDILVCCQELQREFSEYLNAHGASDTPEEEESEGDANSEALSAPLLQLICHLYKTIQKSGQSGRLSVDTADLVLDYDLDPAELAAGPWQLSPLLSVLASSLSQGNSALIILTTFSQEIDPEYGIQIREVRGFRLASPEDGKVDCLAIPKDILSKMCCGGEGEASSSVPHGNVGVVYMTDEALTLGI